MRRGSLFVEVLISIVVFLIGMMALASVMTFSLYSVTCSGIYLKADQELANKVETYMLTRVISHDVTPSDPLASLVSSNKTANIGGFSFNYSVYRYKTPDKYGSRYYILQHEE
mgnify:CR=1 FL=1